MKNIFYVVSRVPSAYSDAPDLWYCYLSGFPYVPVFGSIGDKETAKRVCKERNLDGKVRYA